MNILKQIKIILYFILSTSALIYGNTAFADVTVEVCIEKNDKSPNVKASENFNQKLIQYMFEVSAKNSIVLKVKKISCAEGILERYNGNLELSSYAYANRYSKDTNDFVVSTTLFIKEHAVDSFNFDFEISNTSHTSSLSHGHNFRFDSFALLDLPNNKILPSTQKDVEQLKLFILLNLLIKDNKAPHRILSVLSKIKKTDMEFTGVRQPMDLLRSKIFLLEKSGSKPTPDELKKWLSTLEKDIKEHRFSSNSLQIYLYLKLKYEIRTPQQLSKLYFQHQKRFVSDGYYATNPLFEHINSLFE